MTKVMCSSAWRRWHIGAAAGLALSLSLWPVIAKTWISPSVADPVADLDFPVRTDVPLELAPWFSRYAAVFGVPVFASSASEDWALQHVARSLAKYLDQDEDGRPDHPEVVRELVGHRASMLLTRTHTEYENGVAQVADQINSTLQGGVIKNDHPFWNCSVTEVWTIAEIFQEELAGDAVKPYGAVPPGPPYGRWDAVWEEIFHLITHVGYGCADPDVWGFRADAARPSSYPDARLLESNISRALDAAMGQCGAAYNRTQQPRSNRCKYYYTDDTCFYPCLINEYLHMLHVVASGAADFYCASHYEKEYFFCTMESCKEHDPVGFALGSSGMLPQVLPSGHYRPENSSLVLAQLQYRT